MVHNKSHSVHFKSLYLLSGTGDSTFREQLTRLHLLSLGSTPSLELLHSCRGLCFGLCIARDTFWQRHPSWVTCKLPEMLDLSLLGGCRFFYASSACIYPENRQLNTEVEGGGLKEEHAWPAQVQAWTLRVLWRRVQSVVQGSEHSEIFFSQIHW